MIYTDYPYLADEEDFDKLRKEGIMISKTEIAENLDYKDLPQKFGNEAEDHRALKKLGCDLLKQQGAFDAKFENYSIDVSSRNLKIAIECGDTQLFRVWLLLFNHPCSEWIKELWCMYINERRKVEIVKFIKS